MQRDTRLPRVAHPAFLFEEIEGDPDVLILRLSYCSTPSDEDTAYTEARRRLGHYAQSYLDAEACYDVFLLTASVDYTRASDFSRK